MKHEISGSPVKRSILVLAFLSGIALALENVAYALSIPISCGGIFVGSVDVNVNGTMDGVTGGFRSEIGGPPNTLAAAAAACGENHFNWYQIVSGVHPLIPGGGPQVDPQPGGQGGQWADRLPWYWDEVRPPPGTPGFDPGLLLSANTTADELLFSDEPFGPVGTNLMFMTWLVSLNADGSFHSWHEGFAWTWIRTATGITVGDPTEKGEGVFPTAAQFDNLIRAFDTRIPEPGTALLLAMGLLIIYLFRRRREME